MRLRRKRYPSSSTDSSTGKVDVNNFWPRSMRGEGQISEDQPHPVPFTITALPPWTYYSRKRETVAMVRKRGARKRERRVAGKRIWIMHEVRFIFLYRARPIQSSRPRGPKTSCNLRQSMLCNPRDLWREISAKSERVTWARYEKRDDIADDKDRAHVVAVIAPLYLRSLSLSISLSFDGD